MNNKIRILSLAFLFIFMVSLVSVSAQFVEVDGTNFSLNGKPFYFAGANSYYLFYKPLGNVQELMGDAEDLNISIIRTWGFCDGTCADASGYSFQSAKGVYNEATFLKFDRVIKEASDRGIKLIVPLVNNWDDFGGMCQYVRWCGLPDAALCDADEPWPFERPTEVHDMFYSDSCTKQAYKDYVSYFLNRVNTITGIAYKDDPTIFAWELANEPRARSDATTALLNGWIGEMSAYIKTIDSSHLVTPGGDGGYKDKPSDPEWSWWYHGNEGQDFIGNHQWPGIDFATFRYYPEPGKFDDVDPAVWIPEHIDDAHNIIGKPVIMEEFGSLTDKANQLAYFYGELEFNGANGDTFWLLVDSGTPADGYSVYCPENTVECNVISDHANYMNGLTDMCVSDSECDDGLYCNGVETCVAGNCVAGATVDCSADDLPGIATCNNDPDSNPFTWDYFAGFTSTCDEATDSCTSGSVSYSHNCDIASCGAECEVESDCIATECNGMDGCVGNDYHDYSDEVNLCLGGCTCENNACADPIISYNDSRCVQCTVDADCNDGNSSTIDTCVDFVCEYEPVVSDCVVPYDGMNITEDTVLCRGEYYLPNGINIANKDIVIDCNRSLILGNYSTYIVDTKGFEGIIIENCDAINISGIYSSGDNVTIRNNNLSGIFGSVIILGDNSIVNDNRFKSIRVSGNNNVISNNIMGKKYGDHILRLWSLFNSKIINNTILEFVDWGRGVSLDQVVGIVFENNTIKNGGYAFYCWHGCNDNVLRGNTFMNNVEGIGGDSPINYRNNTIYRNNFINNLDNVGILEGSQNRLDLNGQGNYWDDFDEPSEGCVDSDYNGICDSPYDVGDGVNQDNYPFTTQNGWLNPPSCIVPFEGMVISENTNLCPGEYNLTEGLTIDSNDVVIECNNTLLRGSGTGTGIKASGTIDLQHWMDVTDNLKDMSPIINNISGFVDSINFLESITIKNCRLENFKTGIELNASKNIILEGNEFFDNEVGLSYVVNIESETRNNVFHDNNKGAFLISLNSTFDNNELFNNVQEGAIDGGLGNIVSNNIAYGNQNGILSVGFGNRVFSNNASDNGQNGMGILWSDGTEVYNNIVEQNNKGINIVESTDVKIHDNTANNNKDGIGVSGLFSQGTTDFINISNNIAMQNTRAGIVLSDGMFSQMIENAITKRSKKGHHVVDCVVSENDLNNPMYDFGIIDATGNHVQSNTITGNAFNGGGVYDQYPDNNVYCDAGQGNTYGVNATIAPGDC